MRDEGGVKGRNNKGLVTIDRKIKKDAFYVYKAYWSDEKFVHIASKRFAIRSDEKINLEALDSLGLYDLKDAHPHSLSGGEKQRLQMAISKVSSNQVIIFDEPTSGLDKNSMQKVIALIEEMKLNHTIIVISHDYEFIRNVSDRIVYLADKNIKELFYLEEDEPKNICYANIIITS